MTSADDAPSADRRARSRYRSVTLEDVARESQVAKSTVSRALNNPGRLNRATQLHIQQVADRLGYRPKPAIRATVTRGSDTRRTGTLALLVHDITNPYFLAIIRGAEKQAAASGFNMILAASQQDPHREAQLISRLTKSVDGFLLAYPQMPRSRIRSLAADNQMVVLNRPVAGLPSVVVDPVTGPATAVDHLASFGHRHIAYVAGPAGSWTNGRRWSAIRAGAQAKGITVQRLGPFPATQNSGAGAADAVVAAGATAAIAFNDLIAIGMLTRLAERKVAVPDDLSVLGFDDIFGAGFCFPTLTTLAAPLDDVGRIAVNLLLQALSGTAPRNIVLPAHLVVRRSTGPAPQSPGPSVTRS